MGPTGLSILWFIAIVAMIPLALWLLKRTPYGAQMSTSGSVTRTVASMPLGPNQRIVTLEVGTGESRKWLVLGVTPQSIATLHTMEPGTAPAAPPAPSFSELLSKVRRHGR
ncbi:MAG TPA: flagellar biosynthetic protein FliO [Burkholderiaceae bacterium]|jgi:flagellar protein FliO/FliZ|nr:flagellar biosynthetic protein FliO [Burkholderiaceae bacterium]